MPEENISEPKARKAVLITAILVVIGLAAYSFKAVKESHKSDFERYYTAGCVAALGGDVYKAGGDREFKYLPIFAQMFSLIARPGERIANGKPVDEASPTEDGLMTGATIWYAVLCFSYLMSLWLAVSMCKPDSVKNGAIAALGAIAVSARFFVDNLRLGQINMFVMLMAIFGVWLVYRKKEISGGACVAFAAALKFMPFVLLFWFLVRKRWKAAASFFVSLILFLTVVPAATWGFSGNISLLKGYVTARHKMVTDLPEGQAAGQSLPSMSNRLLRHVNSTSIRRPKLFINLVDAPGVARVMAVVLVVIACGLALYAMRKSGTVPDGWPQAMEAGLIFLLMLLISPEARKAHYITILLPAAAITLRALQGGAFVRSAAWLFAAFVPLALSSSGIWGHGLLYDYVNAYGVVLAGGLILFAACVWSLLHEKTPTEKPSA